MMDQERKELLASQGYSSLEEYFEYLEKEYGTATETISVLYEIFGDEELFDGLVVAIEDEYVY